MHDFEQNELPISKELSQYLEDYFSAADGLSMLREANRAAVADRRRVQGIAIIFAYKLLDVRHWTLTGNSSKSYCIAQGGSVADERHKWVSQVVNPVYVQLFIETLPSGRFGYQIGYHIFRWLKPH